MQDKITQRQMESLRFIREFIQEHKKPPTVTEIGDYFHIKTSSVFAHLQVLEKKGLIKRTPGQSRAIELVEDRLEDATPVTKVLSIPIVGQITAGMPNLAFADIEGYLNVEEKLARKGTLFALRVIGNSMVEADILEGDYVIVRQQSWADSGEIVVALVNNEATVKRLKLYRDRTELWPANPNYNPIVISEGTEFLIQGKVISVQRIIQGSRGEV